LRKRRRRQRDRPQQGKHAGPQWPFGERAARVLGWLAILLQAGAAVVFHCVLSDDGWRRDLGRHLKHI
jgi:hypothetical protein